MEEKRKFFRVRNSGQIEAYYMSKAVDIIELSCDGAVIKKNTFLPNDGTIEIKIHNFSTKVDYRIIRVEEEKQALYFSNAQESNSLFEALKHFRDEKRQHH